MSKKSNRSFRVEYFKFQTGIATDFWYGGSKNIKGIRDKFYNKYPDKQIAVILDLEKDV